LAGTVQDELRHARSRISDLEREMDDMRKLLVEIVEIVEIVAGDR
jgi:hypothetical protein